MADPNSPAGWKRCARFFASGDTFIVRHLLLPLVPRAAYFPDFLTPPQGLLGPEPGIEAILATPRRRIRNELEHLQQDRQRPVWAAGLADGESGIRETLGRALRTYHHHAIAPHWPLVEASITADRAIRTTALRTGGIYALLESFHPAMCWRPPVLQVAHPADRHIHLQGRGLLLIPSYFCWLFPVPLADPGLPPVMVYPIRPELRRGDAEPTHPDEPALTRLLGRTRTAVLIATHDTSGVSENQGCLTGQNR